MKSIITFILCCIFSVLVFIYTIMWCIHIISIDTINKYKQESCILDNRVRLLHCSKLHRDFEEIDSSIHTN